MKKKVLAAFAGEQRITSFVNKIKNLQRNKMFGSENMCH